MISKFNSYYNTIISTPLTEDKVQDLRTIYTKKHPEIEHVFDQLVEIDPSPTKKYLQWMILRYIKDRGIGGDALQKMAIFVPKFYDLTTRNVIQGEDANIEKYKTVEALGDVLEGKEGPTRSEIRRGVSDYEKDVKPEDIVFDNENVIILFPKTTADSQKYGYGAAWCTRAEGESCYFNTYYFGRNSNLYYVIPKDEAYARTPWKKVAVQVDEDGTITVWDHVNKQLSFTSPEVKKLFKKLGIPTSK